MKEFKRGVGQNINIAKDWIKNRDWFPVCLIGGTLLAASGSDPLTPGEQKFNIALSRCEKALVQTDPPVYKLKKPTEVCLKLEQGVSSSQIIAEFNQQAEQERPWGIAKIVVGGTAAAGSLVYMFTPHLRYRRRSVIVTNHKS